MVLAVLSSAWQCLAVLGTIFLSLSHLLKIQAYYWKHVSPLGGRQVKPARSSQAQQSRSGQVISGVVEAAVAARRDGAARGARRGSGGDRPRGGGWETAARLVRARSCPGLRARRPGRPGWSPSTARPSQRPDGPGAASPPGAGRPHAVWRRPRPPGRGGLAAPAGRER
jgi:hypothetical protein